MNKKFTIYTLVFFSLVTVGSILSSVHLLKNIKRTNQQALSVVEDIESKKLDKNNMNLMAKRVSELAEKQKLLNSYFVNGGDVASFVDYLEGLGSVAGLDIKVKNINQVTTDKNKLMADISVNGKYAGVMRLIGLLENAPYKIHIDTIFLSKGSEPVVIDTEKKSSKVKVREAPIWQGSISFMVLSSL